MIPSNRNKLIVLTSLAALQLVYNYKYFVSRLLRLDLKDKGPILAIRKLNFLKNGKKYEIQGLFEILNLMKVYSLGEYFSTRFREHEV